MRSILTTAQQDLATVTLAIDFEPKIGTPLNSAAEHFHSSLAASEVLFANGTITIRSRDPRWAATVGYTRIQFSSLPVIFLLESFREVTSCVFNAAKTLGVDKLNRIGLQVTSWRPLPAIDYNEFTQSVAELSMRPSFLQSFLFDDFDPYIRLEGEGKTNGFRYTASVAPMSIDNVRNSILTSPAMKLLAFNRDLTDDLAAKFYSSVLHDSLFVEIDVSKKGIALDQVRDTLKAFYESAEERIESISKMLGVS